MPLPRLTRKFGRAGAAAATTERREEARPRRAGASARADEADIDADAIVWERARAGVREEANEETNARYAIVARKKIPEISKMRLAARASDLSACSKRPGRRVRDANARPVSSAVLVDPRGSL